MSTVRITSGTYKNAKLQVPPSAHSMGEREKTAIFNSLGQYVQHAHTLDAFAGSGALGLEALSRGASSATFLENNREAQRTIKKNADKLGVVASFITSEHATSQRQNGFGSHSLDVQAQAMRLTEEWAKPVVHQNIKPSAAGENHRSAVLRTSGQSEIFPERNASDGRPVLPVTFDIIFADPPYDRPQLPLVTELSRLLAPSGLLVLSLPKDHPLPDFPHLTLESDKTYARARILTYKNSSIPPSTSKTS